MTQSKKVKARRGKARGDGRLGHRTVVEDDRDEQLVAALTPSTAEHPFTVDQALSALDAMAERGITHIHVKRFPSNP